MKNVSIIMARGIEGCGVTKYTVELVQWLKNHMYNTKIYASKDKNFARKYSHNLGDVDLFKFSDYDLTTKMIEECNQSDLIIINSLPGKTNGRGLGASDECIDNWIRALKSFTKPVVLIQHDHTIYSIKRNAALEEAIDAADIIFVHSRMNDFSDVVGQHTSTGVLSFFEDTNEKKVLNFQPGYDFDELRRKYWKDISEQDVKHHKWIGRTTSWKGYGLMFDWHNQYLAPAGYVTSFEGIEKSPAFLAFKELSDFHNEIKSNPDDFDPSTRYGDKASVFGYYKNVDLLERMSKVGFGYQLSILREKYIESSIEYTHCEVAGIGIIPVFRKEYGEYCIHRVTGDPLIESKNNSTIWLNKDNMEETINIVNKLTNDPIMRNDWREAAFEFYRQHQDSEFVFKDLMNKVSQNL